MPGDVGPDRMAPLVSRFLVEYPRVQYEVTNRRVDVIEQGFDVALRVRMPPLESTDLVMKALGESTLLLVGGRALVDRLGRPQLPADLTRFESLGLSLAHSQQVWQLTGPDGKVEVVPHRPRLRTDEMMSLRQAALDSVGIVQLPDYIVGGTSLPGSWRCCSPAGRRRGPSSMRSFRLAAAWCRPFAVSSTFLRSR
jgi:DNA-binding transcriptional LysR family regulator